MTYFVLIFLEVTLIPLDTITFSSVRRKFFLSFFSFIFIYYSFHQFCNMADYPSHEIIDMTHIVSETRGNYKAAERLYVERFSDRQRE